MPSEITEVPVNEFDSCVTCRYCTCRYVDPRRLRCQHTSCYKCLQKLYNPGDERFYYVCRECGFRYEDEDEPSKDRVVNELMELMDKAQPSVQPFETGVNKATQLDPIITAQKCIGIDGNNKEPFSGFISLNHAFAFIGSLLGYDISFLIQKRHTALIKYLGDITILGSIIGAGISQVLARQVGKKWDDFKGPRNKYTQGMYLIIMTLMILLRISAYLNDIIWALVGNIIGAVLGYLPFYYNNVLLDTRNVVSNMEMWCIVIAGALTGGGTIVTRTTMTHIGAGIRFFSGYIEIIFLTVGTLIVLLWFPLLFVWPVERTVR